MLGLGRCTKSDTSVCGQHRPVTKVQRRRVLDMRVDQIQCGQDSGVCMMIADVEMYRYTNMYWVVFNEVLHFYINESFYKIPQKSKSAPHTFTSKFLKNTLARKNFRVSSMISSGSSSAMIKGKYNR